MSHSKELINLKEKKIIISFLLLLFVSFTFKLSEIEIRSDTDRIQTPILTSDPIEIGSDSDFDTNGILGEGTEESPYIIENLKIKTSGYFSRAIYIHDTTSHFVIRNCIIEHGYFGIWVSDVTDYTPQIFNNTCVGTTNEGIGIVVADFNGGVITENTCMNSGQGIRTIYANFISISENKISNCVFQGINIHHSHFNNITYNVIKNCTDFSVALVGSITFNNSVHHNNFINNAKKETYNIDGELSGLMTSQAYDDGFLNTWYEEKTKTGNQWSDYSGEGPYTIDGSALSVDKYPNKVETERSSLNLGIEVTSLISLLSLSALLRRR